MKPIVSDGNITADCPACGVPTSFEWRNPSSNTEFGSVVVERTHKYNGRSFLRLIHKLYRCAVCARPGVGTFHFDNSFVKDGVLATFWPTTVVPTALPSDVPPGVVNEYREAELCMSVGAWRAAAALFRSAIEKVLKTNGYEAERDLFQRIEAAAKDGVITAARRQRAHDLVRTLGNDVLHDEWREVTQAEAEAAQHYVGRVIEDLYDDRATVEKTLSAANRSF